MSGIRDEVEGAWIYHLADQFFLFFPLEEKIVARNVNRVCIVR